MKGTWQVRTFMDNDWLDGGWKSRSTWWDNKKRKADNPAATRRFAGEARAREQDRAKRFAARNARERQKWPTPHRVPTDAPLSPRVS
jgi:hypothetical protein